MSNRPVVLYVATSLDGYIARETGGVDWLFTDQDYGYRAFMAGVDTVLMGRKTYDLVLTFGEYPYKSVESVVFTRTPREPEGGVRFFSGPIAPFVAELKAGPGRTIWLVGGGEIVAECLRHDLIDEYVVSIHPILLGRGIPLFPLGYPERVLKFQRVETFSSGLVQLFYTRAGEGGS